MHLLISDANVDHNICLEPGDLLDPACRYSISIPVDIIRMILGHYQWLVKNTNYARVGVNMLNYYRG